MLAHREGLEVVDRVRQVLGRVGAAELREGAQVGVVLEEELDDHHQVLSVWLWVCVERWWGRPL
jgi:hypothetical protein